MIDIKKIDQAQAEILKRAYSNKQLAHSFLFVANDQTIAINTAFWLACLYNCQGENKPDGTCQNCQQILSGNHPDVLTVQLDDRQSLSIDQIRPLKEELAKSPVESQIRFFIIEQAQTLTLSAANALLNLLEEPIAPVVTILITNNLDQILPTIRSRTQIFKFASEASLSGSKDSLLDSGFSADEINNLGDLTKLNQSIKYFYEEICEQNDLAIVSAYKLASQSQSPELRKYILFRLKYLAEQDLHHDDKRITGMHMLKYLMDVDKMNLSNVSFKNLLMYLALQGKR